MARSFDCTYIFLYMPVFLAPSWHSFVFPRKATQPVLWAHLIDLIESPLSWTNDTKAWMTAVSPARAFSSPCRLQIGFPALLRMMTCLGCCFQAWVTPPWPPTACKFRDGHALLKDVSQRRAGIVTDIAVLYGIHRTYSDF